MEAVVFLTEGFEEIEALSVVDILRRGGVETATVSLTGHDRVTGSHQITVLADSLFENFSSEHAEVGMLILPGGPGTAHYKKHDAFLSYVRSHAEKGGLTAAICAAPSVLDMLGVLDGKTAVCYPSVEPELKNARLGSRLVETDGAVITSKGPSTAIFFALELLKILKGEAASETVSRQLLIPEVREALRD